MLRYIRPIIYIIKEMLPSLFIGVFVFIAILLMFQILRLTEFLLIHGIEFKTIFQLVLFLSISFLPAILPMSVLFSVLMTYGKLSSDSEIIAFKSLGISQGTLSLPAFIVGLIMTLVSIQTYFFIGPWGQNQFDSIISQFTGAKVVSTIREGTFAEGFYDLVVYANKVDEKKGILKNVFLYDERNPKVPITIIAQEGQVLSSKDKSIGTILRLFDGSLHRTGLGVYTKIKFENYDIFLRPDFESKSKQKSTKAMTIRELYTDSKKTNLSDERRIDILSEIHKRWALPFACLIFSLIGVGLGTVINKRVARSGGFVISVGLIVAYWVSYVSIESAVRNATFSSPATLWIPNILFALFSAYLLKTIWKK